MDRNFSLWGQQRPLSDRVNAQTDLSLAVKYSPFVVLKTCLYRKDVKVFLAIWLCQFGINLTIG